MGYQKVVNSLVKALEREAIDRYADEAGDYCGEVHFGWHCTRCDEHTTVHMATMGDQYLLHVWFEGNSIFTGEEGALELNLRLIETAAVAENHARVDQDDLGESQCNEMSKQWRCTRPKGHTGFHIALRDQSYLLEIWQPEKEDA